MKSALMLTLLLSSAIAYSAEPAFSAEVEYSYSPDLNLCLSEPLTPVLVSAIPADDLKLMKQMLVNNISELAFEIHYMSVRLGLSSDVDAKRKYFREKYGFILGLIILDSNLAWGKLKDLVKSGLFKIGLYKAKSEFQMEIYSMPTKDVEDRYSESRARLSCMTQMLLVINDEINNNKNY